MLKGISTFDTCFLTISMHVFKTVFKISAHSGNTEFTRNKAL